jgi:hypothetical protein
MGNPRLSRRIRWLKLQGGIEMSKAVGASPFWTMLIAGVAAMAVWAMIQYGIARYKTKPVTKPNGTKA